MNIDFDRQHVWHPYSSMSTPGPVFPVTYAEGVYITLDNGQRLIDGMSSWWCMLHGYNHPVLNQAIIEQTHQFAHVMFGGLTHSPAIGLCERLVALTPEPLEHVFLVDSGSIAVEVAIKMALQYWQAKGQPHKHTLLSFKHGYHGDTFGAMSVCDPDKGMHHLFKERLAQQLFMSAPPAGINEPIDPDWVAQLHALLDQHIDHIAAIIIEPIVQGAGGMRFYSPEYLKILRRACDERNILLIFDEIATGFGRTGKLLGCHHADVSPDLMCLGKALTGGYMSLAATLCTHSVANGISEPTAPDNPGVFMHGPTFMANPLACAVASASIDLLLNSNWQTRIARIENILTHELNECCDYSAVSTVRTLGAIGVIELNEPVDLADIQPQFVEAGVWLRPFGKLIYTMPPFIITDEQLRALTQGIKTVVSQL